MLRSFTVLLFPYSFPVFSLSLLFSPTPGRSLLFGSPLFLSETHLPEAQLSEQTPSLCDEPAPQAESRGHVHVRVRRWQRPNSRPLAVASRSEVPADWLPELVAGVRRCLPFSFRPALSAICVNHLCTVGREKEEDVALGDFKSHHLKDKILACASERMPRFLGSAPTLTQTCQALLEGSEASARRVAGVGPPRCWLILGRC